MSKGGGIARYRTLLRYAMPYRTGWALLAVVTLLNIPFSLLQPWPMKILVDNVLGKTPMPAALRGALGRFVDADNSNVMLALVVGSFSLMGADYASASTGRRCHPRSARVVTATC